MFEVWWIKDTETRGMLFCNERGREVKGDVTPVASRWKNEGKT